MSILNLAMNTRNLVLNGIRDAVDADGEPGFLNMYKGERPKIFEEADSRNLLATLIMSFPAAEDAQEGRLDFNDIQREDFIKNTGRVVWARVFSSKGTSVFDCDISTKGAVINLNDTQLFKGGVVDLGSFSFIYPNSEQTKRT